MKVMDHFTAYLFVLVILLVREVSVQSDLTEAERRTARKIVRTLDYLMSPSRTKGQQWVCRHFIDLQIILDSSGSVGAEDFKDAKDATKILVDYINNKWYCTVSRRGSRMALIEFSTPKKTHVEFSFFDHNSARSVKYAIDRIGYDRGRRTATGTALKIAKAQFLQSGRRRNRKVIWLLTDGKSNAGDDPISAANQLSRLRTYYKFHNPASIQYSATISPATKRHLNCVWLAGRWWTALRCCLDRFQSSIIICVVAIGNKVNLTEINAIATHSCVFILDSFSSYKNVLEYAYKPNGMDSNLN